MASWQEPKHDLYRKRQPVNLRRIAGIIARINLGGNFCGHDPNSPVLALTPAPKQGKGGLPRIITKAMAAVSLSYHGLRELLPALDRANGSIRKMRSERREACVLVMHALLKYTDLATLKVGIPNATGFRNLPTNYFAAQAGLSLYRTQRALRDLKISGLISITPVRARTADGSWGSLNAIKKVSTSLFRAMGLGAMLRREQRKAMFRKEHRERLVRPDLDDVEIHTILRRLKAALTKRSKASTQSAVTSPQAGGVKPLAPPLLN